MRREGAAGIKIRIKRVFERVTVAAGTSTRTLSRIAKEGEKLEGQFKSSKKTNPWLVQRQVWTFCTPTRQDTHVIRWTNQFHITHKRHPTVSALLPVIKENINFKGQIS